MFYQLENYIDLMKHFDYVVEAVSSMCQKSRSNAASAEVILRVLIDRAGNDLFILLHADNNDKFDGLLVALFVHDGDKSWLEVIAMSCSKMKWQDRLDANEIMEGWGRTKGATKIVAYLNRKSRFDNEVPGSFLFNKFNKPLGWEIAGIIVRKDLK